MVRFLKSLKTDNFPAVERIMNESLLTLMSSFSWYGAVVRGTALQERGVRNRIRISRQEFLLKESES